MRKGSLRPHYYHYYYLHGGQRLKITSGGVDVPCIYLVSCKRLGPMRVRRSNYPLLLLNSQFYPILGESYRRRLKSLLLSLCNVLISSAGNGDSSVVRVPDSRSKGRGFESLQERLENFLLQGQHSVLTLISVSVPPPCYRNRRKRSRSFCKKVQVAARLQLNTHAPYVCGFA